MPDFCISDLPGNKYLVQNHPFMETSNFLVLAIAALVPSTVGYFYYHPKFLGKYWAAASGNSDPEFSSGHNRPVTIISSIILSFFMAMAIKGIIDIAHEGATVEQSLNNFTHGMFHASIFAFFFMMPILIPSALNERRSWKFIFINLVYWIISFSLMGGIVDQWY